MDFHGPAFVLAIVALSLAGWLINNWIRARHGFSISDDWGRNIDRRDPERLTAENAALRAELDAIKERLATVERIVTEPARRLDHEIERLRSPGN